MRTTYQFRVWYHPDQRYLVSYGNKGELFEFEDKWVDIGWFIQCQRCESAQRFTVQQFTGLRDKNGLPIFEGDTVNFIASPLNAPEQEVRYSDFEVYYSETLASFALGLNEWNFTLTTGVDAQSLEVTGNSFEGKRTMRTIKFRIWDREKKKFLPYACWLNHLDTNDFTCFDRWFKMNEEKCTLQQFTGLKDKNGKYIYEGDFLKFSCNYTFPCGDPDIVEWKNQEVFYDEEKACFFFGRKHEFQILDQVMPETLEITGNIFENPELSGTNE